MIEFLAKHYAVETHTFSAIVAFVSDVISTSKILGIMLKDKQLGQRARIE